MQMIRRKFRILAAALFAAAVLASSGFAATAAEYRKKVSSARSIVIEMIYESANGTAANPDAGFDARKVQNVRELLPAAVTVDGNYGPQEISHAWLHSRLADFVTEKDYNGRLVILSDIEERLSGIIFKLDELEAAKLSGPTKDEEKQKLDEILRREQFQKPSDDEESRFQKWWREFLEWLSRFLPKPEPTSASQPGMPGAAWWLQFVVIGAAVLLIGFLIYKFGPSLMPALRRREREKKDDRVILGERIDRDQNSADVFSEAERLAREGDVRGAIRKGYIALLCELHDRKLIGLARHKTNRDYLRDVRKREVYSNVKGLTNTFERHWYGSKPSDTEAWEKFRTDYKQAVERI